MRQFLVLFIFFVAATNYIKASSLDRDELSSLENAKLEHNERRELLSKRLSESDNAEESLLLNRKKLLNPPPEDQELDLLNGKKVLSPPPEDLELDKENKNLSNLDKNLAKDVLRRFVGEYVVEYLLARIKSAERRLLRSVVNDANN